MPFGLTYRDYLANAPGLNASENAVTPMSQAEWDALPMEQQWGLLGQGSQGISVNKFDPRYQGLLAEAPQQEAGRSFNVMPGVFGSNTNNRGVQRFNDPSQVHQGQGYYSSSEENTTAAAQRQGGLDDKGWGLLVASLFAGGALAGGAGATGTEGLLSAAPGEGFGTAGAAGSANAGAAVSGGAAANSTNSGGFDFSPHQYTGQFSGGTGVGNLGPAFNTNPSILGNVMNGNFSGAASQLGRWAINNPLQAYGAVQTVGGLLNRGGGNSGGSSASSGANKGGSGTGTGTYKAERPQFTPNPYLMAQLRAGGYIQ